MQNAINEHDDQMIATINIAYNKGYHDQHNYPYSYKYTVTIEEENNDLYMEWYDKGWNSND